MWHSINEKVDKLQWQGISVPQANLLLQETNSVFRDLAKKAWVFREV